MRQTFGFQGYFTGDCDAVNEINPQPPLAARRASAHPRHRHRALAFALGAGEDAECNAGFNGTRATTAARRRRRTTAGRHDERDRHADHDARPALHTVNDLDVSATRLFTNRMKLGEFDPDATVPWLTQARRA